MCLGFLFFEDFVTDLVCPAVLESLLEPSDVVGNIRFSHPTLYVFPGGQGDAALFGINGFNMLVNIVGLSVIFSLSGSAS